MARVNKAAAPYYDDYSSSRGFTHLLANPGRVAQAREFTQIQSTLKDIIKSIGDSFMKDGNIVEGCQVLVHSDTTPKTVTVTSGKVYINGMVLPIAESNVTISGVGTEIIGLKLNEEIIYSYIENGKDILKDPAQGYDNYNQPGCDRIKSTVEVVVNDPEAAILSTLVDGAVMVESYAPEYDTLSQTLARRTYDESGSYIVEGLNVRTEESTIANSYNVVIESGKAYILGYELKIPTARRIRASKAITHAPVETNKTFTAGTADYQLYSNPYVKNIINVRGIKSVSENQSLATNVDSVQLSNSNVLRITAVTQGTTSYTVGGSSQEGDCYLEQIGSTYYLKWNGTANYPTAGSTYSVTYEYRKEYLSDTDYSLVLISGSHYIRWIGDTPVNGTVFTVNYNQYLARKDIVYIDRYGNIETIEGVPAEYGHEVAPEAPLNTLTLAIVTNPPNGSVTETISSDAIYVNNVGLTRFTMNDIQGILNRLKTVEYDQAILSLNDEARNEETVNDKKGIFTDPLIDLSRIDFYYNKNSSGIIVDASKPIFDLAVDLSANIAYLPIVTSTSGVTYSSSSTTKKYGRIIALNSSAENTVLAQTNATKSFLINPYSMFPQMPEVSVNPSVDSWIEDTIIQVPVSLTDSSFVSMSTRTIDNTTPGMRNNNNYRISTSTSVSDTSIGTKTTSYSTDSILSEQAITYIRQRVLTVEGKDFPANLDNIKGYFDGVPVTLTPATGTSAGTVAGSVRSDASGYLKATFTIPANILTGSREVLLKSDIVRDGYLSEGFTLYIAQGTSRRIQRTMTTLTTVLLQRTTTTTIRATYVDPVGQTFVLDRMTMIKGIDLYFENKPSVNTPVSCEIREVINGAITSQVYAHASLPMTQVNISSNASVATRFNFDDPVLLEENKEYAFVVRSTSDAYTIWVAELGGVDVLTGASVLKNPYMTGVMLSSSNNSTWSSHQTTDIKFNLIEDVYSMNSVAQFDNLTLSEFSRIYLSADSAIPTGTTISWSYSTDGTTYKSITPYNIITMNDMHTALSLRATLSRLNTVNLSPMIALDTIALTTSCYDTAGAYISKNISGLDAYTSVKIIVDTYEPAGTTTTIKISPDNGDTFITATRTSTATMNYSWRECIYEATVSSSTQCKIFIQLASLSKFLTPAFRRLRVIMS